MRTADGFGGYDPAPCFISLLLLHPPLFLGGRGVGAGAARWKGGLEQQGGGAVMSGGGEGMVRGQGQLHCKYDRHFSKFFKVFSDRAGGPVEVRVRTKRCSHNVLTQGFGRSCCRV